MAWSSLEVLTHAVDAVSGELDGVDERLRALGPERFADEVPALDLQLRGLREEAIAVRNFVVLLRPGEYSEYEPAVLLRKQFGHEVRQIPEPAPAIRCRGDVKQVAACLQLVLNNLPSGGGQESVTALFTGEAGPYVLVGYSNGGAIPERWALGKHITVQSEALGELWSAATGGGSIELTSTGMAFHLSGGAPVSPSLHALAPLEEPLNRTVRALQPWRGAIGMYEEGIISPEEGLSHYQRTVGTARKHLDEARSALDRILA